MVRNWLRKYLGIHNLEENIEHNQENIESNSNQIKLNQENIESNKETIKDNQARIRELEPITVDLTNRQRELLEVFLQHENEKLGVTQIADELNTSRNNAGSILSDLKKKVEFDVQTVDNGKKLYKLPGKERDKIFSNTKR